MGPKKEVQKKENSVSIPAIDDPLNSDVWRCVVVMAVERTQQDSFVLKEFMEEAATERRQEVKLINFDTLVLKILRDFANGELSFKYSYLLNFSPIFQEAAEHVKNKSDIPVTILVKVLKALLFLLREESRIKIERKASGPHDPIKEMAERPAVLGGVDAKAKSNKKDSTTVKEKKTKPDDEPKVRPPSATKQDTKLLKRGEGVKWDACIDDAPEDGYYNLYVLLTGFYYPNLPLELIKADVPLHGLLCIDTSRSEMNKVTFASDNIFQKQGYQTKKEEIKNFWNDFLQILWDPKSTIYFKDIIFQVYIPRQLSCSKQKLKEFIYREISYLMYDISDYKKKLLNYLKHLKLRDVEESKKSAMTNLFLDLVSPPNECLTAPVVLQYIIDAICVDDKKRPEETNSSYSSATESPGEGSAERYLSQSVLTKFDSLDVLPDWSQIVGETGDSNLLSLYSKTKELDVKYHLDKVFDYELSEQSSSEEGSISSLCHLDKLICGENMKAALNSQGSALKSCWNKFKFDAEAVRLSLVIDHCLYPLLMTKVACPYQDAQQSFRSSLSSLKNASFEKIENLDEEMQKPHFTVTEGSRAVLRCVPFNVKDAARDFFSPAPLKIVTPEKLKASSAPEFRLPPHLKVQASFISDFLPHEIPAGMQLNVFENLRKFLGEHVLSSSDEFDFVEELSKEKLLLREFEHWNSYNCVDYSYSFLNDSVFVVLHNRKDKGDFHHETFNEILKTGVGLRDFFEYILEDESEWFETQSKVYQNDLNSLQRKSIQRDVFRDFPESDFWLNNSIKYEEYLKFASKSDVKSVKKSETYVKKAMSVEKPYKKDSVNSKGLSEEVSLESDGPYHFEGYNICDMAVQYSGLKTAYYEGDCNIAVELTERLYGDQDLGLHVSQGGHTLHLHSYACPRPHIFDPYTCHLVFKNGIIMAFSRRFIESFEEVEEIVESKTTLKNKKSSSELSTTVVKRKITTLLEDDGFLYEMKLSYPNSLTVKTVRRIVKPCYIKQEYLVRSESNSDRCRLFLPNGSMVKLLIDDKVQILKMNTSVVTASLEDLVNESDELAFQKYEIVTTEGHACAFEQGNMVSSTRLQIFQNTDVETNQTFFRRRDGTNYLLQNDGTLCVQFKDGTKISSSPFVREEPYLDDSQASDESEVLGEFDNYSSSIFLFVHLELVFEHADYATVVYNTETQKWKILLPFESTITVEPEGNYSVAIDRQTEFKIENKKMQMNRFSSDEQLTCSTTADLTVFEEEEGGIYCQMENSSGKTIVVEANSQCYVLNNESSSQDLNSIHSERKNQLSRKNKYFMARRDITGLEVLHKEDVRRTLTETEEGEVVFTQQIPNSENRIFVLISPALKKKTRKWEVETILPDPKFSPGSVKKVSSTYGQPPSWMHPFPKQKAKFPIPEAFKGRVFIETKPTELSPEGGSIDCVYCEVEEVTDVKHTKIVNFQDYIKRLSDEDQDILREMYKISVADLMRKKKKQKPVNEKELQHYLEMSKYYVEMQEYHKKCIRYHIVPDYFHHPLGMSWLILNDIASRLPLSKEKTRERVPTKKKKASSCESISTFSSDEIEYDLSMSTDRSFSDLSYRSDISAHTAPTVIETRGICRCKVQATRTTVSAPLYRLTEKMTRSEETLQEIQQNICHFHEDDIELLDTTDFKQEEVSPLTFEDLMCLGLV